MSVNIKNICEDKKMEAFKLKNELELRAHLFEDDEYVEYDEQVIDRDEYYDPPEGEQQEYADDYPQEEYQDEYYDDGYGEAPIEGEGYDYVDPMQQVLDELNELRQKVNVPSYPVPNVPYVYTNNASSQNYNEAMMLNEISRLRDELSRTQQAQNMHIELTKLREEMAREAKATENQLLAEIKRLTEKVNEQSKNLESPQYVEYEDDEDNVHEGVKNETVVASGISAQEFSQLISLNEQILKSCINGDNKVLAELEKVKKNLVPEGGQVASGEMSAILNQLYSIKGDIAHGLGVAPVASSEGGGGGNNSEVVRLLFDIKRTIGNISTVENRRSEIILDAFNSLDRLKLDLASPALTISARLKLLIEFEQKLAKINENDAKDLTNEYLVIRKHLFDEPINEISLKDILEFNIQNNRKYIGHTKELKIKDFYNEVKALFAVSLEDLIGVVQPVVDFKNVIQNNTYVAENDELYNQIIGLNADILTAQDDAAANAIHNQLNELLRELGTLQLGDIIDPPALHRPKTPLSICDLGIFEVLSEIKEMIASLEGHIQGHSESEVNHINASEQSNQAVSVAIDESIQAILDEIMHVKDLIQIRPRAYEDEAFTQTFDAENEDVLNEIRDLRSDNLDSLQKLLEITELSQTILRHVESGLAYTQVAPSTSEQVVETTKFFDENGELVEPHETADIARLKNEIINYLKISDERHLQQNNAFVDEIKIENMTSLEALKEECANALNAFKEEASQILSSATIAEDIIAQNQSVVEAFKDANAQQLDDLKIENLTFAETIKTENAQFLEDLKLVNDEAVNSVREENQLVVEDIRNEFAGVFDASRQENTELIESFKAENTNALESFKAENASTLESFKADAIELIDSVRNENELGRTLIIDDIKHENNESFERIVAENGLLHEQLLANAQDSFDRLNQESAKNLEVIIETVRAENSGVVSALKEENSQSIQQGIEAVRAEGAQQLELNAEMFRTQSSQAIEQSVQLLKAENELNLEQNIEAFKAESAQNLELLKAENELNLEQNIEAYKAETSLALEQGIEAVKSDNAANVEIISGVINELRAESAGATEGLKEELSSISLWLDHIRETVESHNLDEVKQDLEEFKVDLSFIREQVTPIEDGESPEQVIIDTLNEIKSQTATSDTQYDILAELAALKDSLSAFQFEEGFDLVTEIETIKQKINELFEMGNLEVLSEVQSLHDDFNIYRSEQAEANASQTPEASPQILAEIAVVKEELSSLREELNERYNAALTVPMDSELVTGEITALRDDFVALKETLEVEHPSDADTIVLEQEFIERHSQLLDELTVLKEEMAAIRDNLNKRAQAMDVAEGNISDDYSLVLGEIVSLKNEVIEFKDEIRTKVDETDNNIVLNSVEELNKNLEAQQESEAERAQTLRSISESNESVASLVASIRDDFTAIKEEIANSRSKESEVEATLSALREEIAGLKEQKPADDGELLSLVVALREEIAELKNERPVVDNSEILGFLQSLKEDIAGIKQQQAIMQEEDSVLQTASYTNTDDVSSSISQLHSDISQIKQTSANLDSMNEILVQEVLSIKEELTSFKNSVGTRQVQAVEGASEDYGLVLGEIISLREQIAANKRDIDNTLQSGASDNDSLVYNELVALREQIAANKRDIDNTLLGGSEIDLSSIRDDIQEVKHEISLLSLMGAGGESVDISGIMHEVESIKSELSRLGSPDMSQIESELGEIKAELIIQSAMGESNISQQSMQQLLDAVSAIQIPEAQSDEAVMGELGQIRKEIGSLVSRLAAVEEAEEDSLVILDELGNLREVIQSAKDEPDFGVLNEVLVLREEFANMKDELGRVSDYKKLADKLDSLTESLENLKSKSEALDEETAKNAKAISEEINILKHELSSNTLLLDEVRSVREELATKAGDAQLDDLKIFIMSDIAELKEEIAKNLASGDEEKNQQILAEINKLKEDFAASMEANETAMNFMAGLTSLVGKQASPDAEIINAINRLRDEVAATKGEEKQAKSKKGDISASFEDLKNELTSIAGIVNDEDKKE